MEVLLRRWFAGYSCLWMSDGILELDCEGVRSRAVDRYRDRMRLGSCFARSICV